MTGYPRPPVPTSAQNAYRPEGEPAPKATRYTEISGAMDTIIDALEKDLYTLFERLNMVRNSIGVEGDVKKAQSDDCKQVPESPIVTDLRNKCNRLNTFSRMIYNVLQQIEI